MARRTRKCAYVALLFLFFSPIFCLPVKATAETNPNLRIQLNKSTQSQFAGYYVARDLGYFLKHGISVKLIEGSSNSNSINSLFNGDADVAQASMSEASSALSHGKRAVNIAQIFQKSDASLICRRTDFIKSENNLINSIIAVSDDHKLIVEKVLQSLDSKIAKSVRFINPLPGIENLLNGSADCMFGSEFDEYWKAKELGLPIFEIRADEKNIVSIDDGLYVDELRLSNPEFREKLLALFLGLKEGWELAASSPATAVQLVLNENPKLEYISQRRQLELVLSLITDDFGYFNPANYQKANSWGLLASSEQLNESLWTHRIYDAAAKFYGESSIANRAIREQLERTRSTSWYIGIILMAIFAYAVSASIIGLKLGYRIWGLIVLAGLIALGGGVVRDLLVARQRSPLAMTINPIDLYAVTAGVIFTIGVAQIAKNVETIDKLNSFAKWADAFGFAILSVNGAAIATVAGLPLIWAPICSALTVAGGGVLLDIVIRREHTQFRHEIYEEIAIVAALILAGAFAFASSIEQPILVPISFSVMCIVLTYARYVVVSRNIRYPARRSPVIQSIYQDSKS